MDQLSSWDDVVGVVSHSYVNYLYSAIWIQCWLRHALFVAGMLTSSLTSFGKNISDGLHWEIFLVGVGVFPYDGHDARQSWILFMLGLFGFPAGLLLFSCVLRNHPFARYIRLHGVFDRRGWFTSYLSRVPGN